MQALFPERLAGRILIALNLCLPIAASCQFDNPQPPASASKDLSVVPTAVYQKWLDEVRWIITHEEMEKFRILSNNTDRDTFVVEFWKLRDPTPDTPENEFKEEHYRRIAYSNLHFAASLRGSMTDRGRIYVVYGPPDETIAIPKSNNAARMLVWRYRGVPARVEFWGYETGVAYGHSLDFKFVDECDCNDYRLRTLELTYAQSPECPIDDAAAAEQVNFLKNALSNREIAPECIQVAIEKVGFSKAQGAIGVLINYLAFERPSCHDGFDSYWACESPWRHSAGSELVGFGKEALPALAGVVSGEASSSVARSVAIETIMLIFRNNGGRAEGIKYLLFEAAHSAESANAERLRKAASSAMSYCHADDLEQCKRALDSPAN